MKLRFFLVIVAILGAFAITELIPKNVYATVGITRASWNDVVIQSFDGVVPSEDMPLEFFFQSKDDNNTDVATNFQCMIYRINEDADLDKDNIQYGIDLDGDGTKDVAQSDLTQVASDNCGTNTATGDISYVALSTGSYVFTITGTPLAGTEPVRTTAFPFQVPPYQVSESSKAADTYNPRIDPSINTFSYFKQENATFINFEKVLNEKMLISNISALACFNGGYYVNESLWEVPCDKVLIFLSQEDISSVPSNSSISSLFLNTSVKSSSVYDALKYGINGYHFVCVEYTGESISKYNHGCRNISIAYKNN
jgi:hypothetical protein